ACRIDRPGKLDRTVRRLGKAERPVIGLVADQQHECNLRTRKGQAASLAHKKLAGALPAVVGVGRQRPKQITIDAADTDRRHPDRRNRLAADLGDKAQALIDGEALTYAESGTREPARPEGQRLQRLDELIIFWCSETTDGLDPLRRLGGRGLQGWHAHVTCPQNEQSRTKNQRLQRRRVTRTTFSILGASSPEARISTMGAMRPYKLLTGRGFFKTSLISRELWFFRLRRLA